MIAGAPATATTSNALVSSSAGAANSRSGMD
jgi:hypothetical protein